MRRQVSGSDPGRQTRDQASSSDDREILCPPFSKQQPRFFGQKKTVQEFDRADADGQQQNTFYEFE